MAGGCKKNEVDVQKIYTITANDDGHGSAAADPEKAAAGTDIKLTATPHGGYNFKQWVVVSGGITLDNHSANPAKFKMPEKNVVVRADFAVETYSVTVDVEGYGTAVAEPDNAAEGTEVRLTATAGSGYVFKQWVVVSGGVTLDNPEEDATAFTMPGGDVVIQAVFIEKSTIKYTISVRSTDDAYGSASADIAEALPGTVITLTANPNAGFEFSQWAASGTSVILEDENAVSTTFVMPAADVEIEAGFIHIVFNVVVTHNEYGNTSTSHSTAILDDLVTISSEPLVGYIDMEWSVVKGNTILDVGPDGNATFTMPPEDVEINVVFGTGGGVFEAIEDNIFRDYCRQFDTDGDHILTLDEAWAVESIVVPKMGIKSLKGIAYFKNITSLDCSENVVWELDVKDNTKLEYLCCLSNEMNSLNVTGCPALSRLLCNANRLRSLDVTRCTALIYLACYTNYLTSIDVTQNTELDILSCDHNSLTALDVSKNTKLTDLMCSYNQLTELDATHMTFNERGAYRLICGKQGLLNTTTLTLTLREDQKEYWARTYANNIHNTGVVLAE